jgi:putative transcriptional regulator
MGMPLLVLWYSAWYPYPLYFSSGFITYFSECVIMKNNLKPHRQIAGLTQEELAEKVQVSRQTIHAIEKGKYNPSVQLALKLARVLEKELTQLFELEDGDWQD